MKPTVCGYTSLFALIEARNVLNGNITESEKLNLYAADYCGNLEGSIGAKLGVINRLSTFDPKEKEFEGACIDAVSKAENKWYDPVLPSEIITYGDTCQAIKELFI